MILFLAILVTVVATVQWNFALSHHPHYGHPYLRASLTTIMAALNWCLAYLKTER